jgi:predicted DCC family thiol-disulfide oxidoreductase YuxK
MKSAARWHLPLGPATAYSWRADPSVPTFNDADPIIIFDGVCVLCSGFVHWVIRHDRDKQFRFVAAQSPLGQAIYRHIELPTEVFETNLLIAGGFIYGKSEAFFRIIERLGPPWSLLGIGRLCPASLRTWFYDRIARNRYRLFGRTESCMAPAPDIAGRFLT